jgi:hypothetical protein
MREKTVREKIEKMLADALPSEEERRLRFCRANPYVAQHIFKNLNDKDIEAITLGLFEGN